MINYKNIMFLLLPFIVILGIISLYQNTQISYVKYLPTGISFLLFTICFISLFQNKTIIQRFFSDNIYNNIINTETYLKNLTYLWALLFFINFFISLATVSLSTHVWILYNSVYSFILLYLFLILEIGIRLYLKAKNNKDDDDIESWNHNYIN